MTEFYVYVHRRADTGAPFYVGKGKGARSRVLQHRNPYWRAVAAKAGGFSVEIAAASLDEELALLAEMELIAKLKATGATLTNLTDGGEGMSGYKHSAESIERSVAPRRGKPNLAASRALKGKPKSAEHRAKLSAACIGRRASNEARRKMSESRKGRPVPNKGKRHQPETIEKIAAANRGEKNKFFGKTHDAETIAKIRAANVGRKDSDQTRKRKSNARRGALNPAFGTHVDAERKERQLQTLLATIRASLRACERCGKVADPANLKRWHGANCKGAR